MTERQPLNVRRFFALYPPDAEDTSTASGAEGSTALPPGWHHGVIPTYEEFITSGGGRKSYGNGIIRFLSLNTTPSLTGWNSAGGWVADWDEWYPRLYVFAYDWLGRQFAFDRSRRDASTNEPLIAFLEPGTGEVLKIPATFVGFMDSVWINFHDAALASSFYFTWRNSGGIEPRFDECIGYKIPLFLSDKDDISNLEKSDLSVYVSLIGQLFQQVT